MSYQLPSAFLQKFTPKEIHELKRVFKEHDNDYAAAISVGDLHPVLLKMGENVTPTQVTTILKQVQLERPTQITFQEFLHLFYDLRNGGIAVDAATLISQVSISPPVHQQAAAPVAPVSTGQPSWSSSTHSPDNGQAAAAAPQATSPSPFAQKAQWPPAASSTAAVPPAAPSKPSWPPTNKTTTPPKETTTTSKQPQWAKPVASSAPSPVRQEPSPTQKPQWPPSQPAAATSASPAKPQWPPVQTQQAAAPSPSPAKPQWPPTAPSAAPTSPSKPQWPPATPAATAAPVSPSKPQWPPAAPSPARQEPSPSQKPKWPPTTGTQPSPTPAAAQDKRSQWPLAAPTANATASPAALDAHAIGVLERRASGAALFHAHSSSSLHQIVDHSGQQPSTSKHSYSEEETAAFTQHINNCLHHDRDLKLPMDATQSGTLFQCVRDGILLCKLVNAAVPETIDLRAINLPKKAQLNVYEMTENQNLCIQAAKSIGCSVVNIGPTDLIQGKPILVLGLVWQIIKIQLTATINLKSHPELVRLLLDGESLEAFMKLPPDQILLRWMNYHLKAANYSKQVTNFSSDLQDANAYSVLLHQIAPQVCDLCHEQQAEERASHVIANARKLQIDTFLKPRDITNGNPKLNMSFVAQLFNTCPALDIVEDDLKQLEEILYDDSGDTREERVFRMWINSLGIDEVYINHLFSDLSDGINLLKVFEKIEKGIVSWQKVNLIAPNKFKQVENCNYCVVLGKQLHFSLVNIGGADIFEGNKKLILSVIWQSMRHQQLKLLSELASASGIHTGGITDGDIIQWANAKVLQGGNPNTRPIVAFRDLSLSDGLYLLSLIHAVEPRAVNWEMVVQQASPSDEQKASNAKYAISCAQKIGASVFVTYEDIVEVKPKMMMTFVASLMFVDLHRH